MSTVRTYPPDLFSPREPECAKAVSILDDMAERRRDWLRRMRNALASIYQVRVTKYGEGDPRCYVTADDARRLMEQHPRVWDLPAGASPNLLGSLFRSAEWKAIDREHVSSTTGSHGNILTRWRYVGPERSAA